MPSSETKETLEAEVARLKDKAEIVDALYRFAAGQDLKDQALFESAFSTAATLDFTRPAARFGATIPVMQGRMNIREAVFSAISKLDTTHTVTNPRIISQGDAAKLSALVEAQHVLRADPGKHLLLKNIYSVDLSREGSVWLITAMTIDNIWFSGEAAVLFGN
jgi:hypothetical protein